jgi:hypothetical protein
MKGSEKFNINLFEIETFNDKISSSKEIDDLSDQHGVRNVPDSLFGNNYLKISCPLFNLVFSGKDSIRTMKTSPSQSIGYLNKHLLSKEVDNNSDNFKISNKEEIEQNFTSQTESKDKIVHVEVKNISYKQNEVFWVPPINVKVGCSNLWKNKPQSVGEKLQMEITEEEVEQDWTYLNAYEGNLQINEKSNYLIYRGRILDY